jgi:hypothetical protein
MVAPRSAKVRDASDRAPTVGPLRGEEHVADGRTACDRQPCNEARVSRRQALASKSDPPPRQTSRRPWPPPHTRHSSLGTLATAASTWQPTFQPLQQGHHRSRLPRTRHPNRHDAATRPRADPVTHPGPHSRALTLLCPHDLGLDCSPLHRITDLHHGTIDRFVLVKASRVCG